MDPTQPFAADVTASNPYGLPDKSFEILPEPALPKDRIYYYASLQYIFENREWFVNLAVITVMVLGIGFALQAVLFFAGPLSGFANTLALFPFVGYFCEVSESLHRFPSAPYPLFRFNRLQEYMQRGIAPLIVEVIYLVCFACLSVATAFVFGTIATELGQAQTTEQITWIAVLATCVIAIAALLSSILIFIYTPFFVRATFAASISEAFSIGWSIQFLRLTWLEILKVGLFQLMLASIMGIVGFVTCCLGVGIVLLVTMGPIMIASRAQLVTQMYELFLERGGEAIPMRELPVAATEVVSPLSPPKGV